MKQLFSIGPFNVHLFGVMIAIGAMVGLWLFIREAKRRGFDYNILTDGALYSILGGFVGARLIYVLVYNPAYYLANPLEILFVHEGGLSIHGGILGGLLVGYLFIKKHQLPLWEIFDTVAPALILAQGISRIGCDVFGAPVANALPWAVEVNGELLHPAQVYEFMLDYLLFAYLWIKRTSISYHGQIFLHYLIGFLIIRGIVEFSRINPMIFGPFSVSHLLSALGIAFALVLIWHRKKSTQNQPLGKHVEVDKSEVVKTILATVALAIISLVIYYLVQG